METQTSAPMRQRVAEEVRVALARRRLSASELARRMGVTQRYISRRLTAEIAFDVDDLQHVASALGVAVTDLLPADARQPRTGLRTVDGVTYGTGQVKVRYQRGPRRSTRHTRTAPDTKAPTGRPGSRTDDHPRPEDVTPRSRTGQAVRRPRRISATLPDAA